MTRRNTTPLRIAHGEHDRHWRSFAYCYPVVSRRSRGLSIGINLNPDKACNLDCIYCQVDRSTPAEVRKVNLAVLAAELHRLLVMAADGTLFAEPPFDCLAGANRAIRDIAFSGDGEPTAYPRFDEAIQIAAEARDRFGLSGAKLVLITDACYLTRPGVRRGLARMDANNGEIWAKLDAGTEAYYQQVNRPNYPLAHVLTNILDAARARPIVIQSLWMKIHGEPPPDGEVRAFGDRLCEILDGGGQFKLIQVYTIARRTAEAYATALSRSELDRVASIVSESVQIPIEAF